jgi:hypothetical protein
MLERQDAILIQEHALAAIRELSKLLQRADGKCSEAELSQIKRAVGTSIGEIQVGILDLVGAAYPDLDDLS